MPGPEFIAFELSVSATLRGIEPGMKASEGAIDGGRGVRRQADLQRRVKWGLHMAYGREMSLSDD